MSCGAEGQRPIGRDPKKRLRLTYLAGIRVRLGNPTIGAPSLVRVGSGAGHGIDVDLGLAHESALKEADTDAIKPKACEAVAGLDDLWQSLWAGPLQQTAAPGLQFRAGGAVPQGQEALVQAGQPQPGGRGGSTGCPSGLQTLHAGPGLPPGPCSGTSTCAPGSLALAPASASRAPSSCGRNIGNDYRTRWTYIGMSLCLDKLTVGRQTQPSIRLKQASLVASYV